MTGVLEGPTHVLSLVRRLHPTPAVGGVPQEAALDFIGRHEGVERGWYAAPFGWCTQQGDGHFVVALRSALLSGNKVHVYAGAGIVARSDASAEYAETELKMGSVLRSLGLAS
jgi:salicylate biosynthesis isochorismate synthase